MRLPVAGAVAGAAYTTLGNINDLKAGRLEKFTAQLKATKASLQKVAAAKDSAVRKQAISEYHTNQAELQKSFHQELHTYKLQNNKYLRGNRHVHKMANKLQKQGWEVYDEFTMQKVERMNKVLKRTSQGFMYFDLVNSGTDILDSYLNDGDWQAAALKEGLKFGIDQYIVPIATKESLNFVANRAIFSEAMLGLEAAGVVALDFMPIGWIGVIAIAGIEAAEMMGADKLIDRYL